LILLLGICVPKRLLPVRWLVVFGALLTGTATGVAAWKGIVTGLVVVLTASLLLQVIVLGMAVMGSRHLHFEKSGYWLRVGSSLIHMGVILFVLDLILYKNQSLHLFLFWVTTISTVLGMLFCFYAQGVADIIIRMRAGFSRQRLEK
jgi:peptidoglycan biosynthesis protein MviN/MurJ (putative lipid II flippase)